MLGRMLIPHYWAEARLRQRNREGQVTIRRFGWSDESQQAAQDHAEGRARDAMARWNAGERKMDRREWKRAYNGGQGLPIREEVVARQGDAVITRNLYGARCLNTPNVLFADIDFERRSDSTAFIFPISFVVAIVVGLWEQSGLYAILTLLGIPLVVYGGAALCGGMLWLTGGNREKRSRKRIEAFAQRHPDWHLRLYRTPAGFRLLAMHRPFSPGEPEVAECFRQLGVDKVYALMCQNQQCFRARVSPKPWRIGIARHIKPHPGIWPIKPERMPVRRQWVDDYEQKSAGYAACRFVETIGSSTVDPTALAVQTLHDELCRATSTLPTA